MAFSLKAMVKSFGFQWILVGTCMNQMGDNISYLAQLCTTNLASSTVWSTFKNVLEHFYGKKSNTTLVDTLHGSKFCRLDEIIQYIFLPAWHGINFSSKGPFYPSGKKLLWAKKIWRKDAGTFDTVLLQRCIHALQHFGNCKMFSQQTFFCVKCFNSLK